jgi:hypothetical protein
MAENKSRLCEDASRKDTRRAFSERADGATDPTIARLVPSAVERLTA